jgi:hypothetical protein
VIAHVGGLPAEELLGQLAPVAAGGLVALSLLRARARSWARAVCRRRLRTAVAALAALVLALAWSGTALADSGAGPPTITASFSDGCRDLSAHASKEISYVKLRYADGRVVTDRTTNSPDYSLDGGPGDELDSAILRSGRTTETFTCPSSSVAPTAVLEVKTPEGHCSTWPDGKVDCDGRVARTTWTHSTTALGYGLVSFFCGWPDDQSCVDHVMPCGQKDGYSLCRATYIFRGTSSTDPDDDIVSWSIDFGDGTSVSGDWTTNPPTEVSHEYLIHHCPTCSRGPATLTVTNSAGQADSDAQLADHVYPE